MNCTLSSMMSGINSDFTQSVELIAEHFNQTAIINLLDVLVNKEGYYIPKIVLEPDYLVDVSSIAECFQPSTIEPISILLKRFLLFNILSIPIMRGNITNFFLDELLQDPDAKFETLFPKTFALNPLTFAQFSNAQVKELMLELRSHFFTLKKVMKHHFEEQGIERSSCFVEPSFYSESYGIQGRLDVWHKKEDNSQTDVIELKSSKLFNRINTESIKIIMYKLYCTICSFALHIKQMK